MKEEGGTFRVVAFCLPKTVTRDEALPSQNGQGWKGDHLEII